LIDLNFKYKTAIELIKRDAPFRPDISIILGSGLGSFADTLDTVRILNNADLPDYPAPAVPGHSGKICFSRLAGKNILLFSGRIHLYEGYKLYETVLPVLFSKVLGSKYILLTNAAGGVNASFAPGDLMLADSFNGMFMKKELTGFLGLAGIENKNNLIDFPSNDLNNIIMTSAKAQNINLKRGVYWYTKGPSYETPAEIRMIKKYGGDAVGMSTVQEAVFASWLGMKASAVSCITNYASGISSYKLSHKEVTTTARQVEEKFGNLLRETIKNLSPA
jgi:purine-nucleoside phosphorylase